MLGLHRLVAELSQVLLCLAQNLLSLLSKSFDRYHGQLLPGRTSRGLAVFEVPTFTMSLSNTVILYVSTC